MFQVPEDSNKMNEKIERMLASQWDSRLRKVDNKFVKTNSRIPSPDPPQDQIVIAVEKPAKPVLLRESKLVLNEGLLERLRSPSHQIEFYQAIQESMQSADKFPPKLVQEGHKKGSINPGQSIFNAISHMKALIFDTHFQESGTFKLKYQKNQKHV